MNAVKKLRSLTLVSKEDNDDEDYERPAVVMGKYSDRFYGRPEEDDRCYLPSSELAWLLRADHILECMAKCGIHNTQEYEDAIKMHKETYE